MPKEKRTENIEGVVTSRVIMDKSPVMQEPVYELKIGDRILLINAPHEPDATLLAHVLCGKRVKYTYVERPRGKHGGYRMETVHELVFLDGPLEGKVFETNGFPVMKEALHPPLPIPGWQYDKEVIEGVVATCRATRNGKSLEALIDNELVSIPLPVERKEFLNTECAPPDPELLAAVMQGERICYERCEQLMELHRRKESGDYYQDPRPLETAHHLEILTGPLSGYVCAYRSSISPQRSQR
jgi:hypothetical protein